MPRLSVVIPTYNSRDLLRSTLEGLAAQKGDFEVVVVDDGSTDGTSEMLADLRIEPPLRTVREHNRGRAAARNLGAAHAESPVLLFLDADVRPEPGLIAAHLRHYSDGESLGVQGRTLQDPATMATTFMRATNLFPDMTVRRRHDLAPHHVITRNFSVSRRAFEDAGGFDEAFAGYGWEDIELAFRLRDAGVRLHYEPDALAFHRHAQSLDQLLSKVRQSGEGAVYFWRKHGRPHRLGFFLEIHPTLLPLKWLVFRSGIVTALVERVLPWAERRRILPLCSECYAHLLWRSYYDGVFEALRS